MDRRSFLRTVMGVGAAAAGLAVVGGAAVAAPLETGTAPVDPVKLADPAETEASPVWHYRRRHYYYYRPRRYYFYRPRRRYYYRRRYW